MTKALILAGGKSTRMGSDKYLLNVNGSPQYQHLYHMVEELGLSAYISCSADQSQVIPEEYPVIVDKYDAVGPMGGLTSAIAADPVADWLVIACDLINLNKSAIKKLMNAVSGPADIVAYKIDKSDRYEATLAIYRPSSFPAINSAISSGEYSLQRILRQCKVLTIQPENEDCLKNANYPGDLD